MKRWLLPFELIDMVRQFFATVTVALARLGVTRSHGQRILVVLVACLIVATALRATIAYGPVVVAASLIVGGLLGQRDIRGWFIDPDTDTLQEDAVVAEAERALADSATPR